MESMKRYCEEVSDEEDYSNIEDMNIELVLKTSGKKVRVLQDLKQKWHKTFEYREKDSPQSSTPVRSSNPSTTEGVSTQKKGRESTSNTSSKSRFIKKRGPKNVNVEAS